MEYLDCLPKQAMIASPIIYDYKLTVVNPHTALSEDLYTRKAYEHLLKSFGESTGTPGNRTFTETGLLFGDNGLDVGHDFADYFAGSITINNGDFLNFYDVGLRFRYAGADPLIFSKSLNNDWYDKNPLLLDVDNERVNSSLWVSYGSTGSFLAKDGSNTSELELNSDFVGTDKMYLKAQTSIYSAQPTGMYFSGVRATSVYVKAIETISGTVVGEFEIDMTYRTKLYLQYAIPTNKDGILLYSTISFEVYFIGEDVDEISVSSATLVRDKSYYPRLANKEFMFLLGSTLIGHTQNRVSEFKTVVSDNTEKQMVIKSYDVFDGSIRVDEVDLQKVEYILAKATQGDYIFHIGSPNEIYDQRVYLCKIKYSSPIADTSNIFKIKISGQSLAHKVENPLIAPDSTDGYPV